MNTYRRLMRFLQPYRVKLGVAIICMIFAALTNLAIPWILKDVIDDVLAAKDMFKLNIIAGGILINFFLRAIFFYGQTYLMSFIGQKIIIDIRDTIYRQLQRLSLSYYERTQTGTIMSYVTNDVAIVQGAMADSVMEIVSEGSVLIGSIAAMFYLNWRLALVTFITLPLVMHTINIFGRKLRTTSMVMQERTADITALLQEAISGIRVIRSFVREDYEIDRFSQENMSNFRAQMKNAQLTATLTPVIEFLAALGVTVIIWYGGREVISGALTAGSLTAFIAYIVNFTNPIKRLSRSYANIQRALAAADRIFEVLDIEPEIKDLPGASSLPRIQGEVTFHHLDFAYNDNEYVLSDISVRAQPGQMIAIVGSSGSGKTTFVNLIPRFYDPVSGTISIDGIDIKTVTLASLRGQIGLVPQETMLFSGTVYDNIRYGRLEATAEEVKQAAMAANAHNFISAMPRGYETQIGERGSKLSGGQRQRIAIARAILKDPRVLILDEATSALDSESEKLVQDALDKLMIGRTTFVIAHRLSTVQRADVILVMEKGRIVEQGTHEQLLAKGGLYNGLHQVQFNIGSAEGSRLQI